MAQVAWAAAAAVATAPAELEPVVVARPSRSENCRCRPWPAAAKAEREPTARAETAQAAAAVMAPVAPVKVAAPAAARSLRQPPRSGRSEWLGAKRTCWPTTQLSVALAYESYAMCDELRRSFVTADFLPRVVLPRGRGRTTQRSGDGCGGRPNASRTRPRPSYTPQCRDQGKTGRRGKVATLRCLPPPSSMHKLGVGSRTRVSKD